MWSGVGLTFFLDQGSYLCPVLNSALFCVASFPESFSFMRKEDGSQKPQAPTVLPASSPYWSTEAFQLALLDRLWSITESSEVACSDHMPSTAVWWVMPLDWHLNQNHFQQERTFPRWNIWVPSIKEGNKNNSYPLCMCLKDTGVHWKLGHNQNLCHSTTQSAPVPEEWEQEEGWVRGQLKGKAEIILGGQNTKKWTGE